MDTMDQNIMRFGIRIKRKKTNKKTTLQESKTDKYYLLSGSLTSPTLIRSNSANWGKAQQDQRNLLANTGGGGRPRHRMKPQPKASREYMIDELWQDRHIQQRTEYTESYERFEAQGEQKSRETPKVRKLL